MKLLPFHWLSFPKYLSCIAEFRFLKRLILVHGRYSYNRTAFLSQYSFYKSLVICFIQILWVPKFNASPFVSFRWIWFPRKFAYRSCWHQDTSVSLLFQVSLGLVFSILLAWWPIMFSILAFLFWSVSLTKILVKEQLCSIHKFYFTAKREGLLFPTFLF